MCFSCILYDHSTLHGFLSWLKCMFGSRNVIHTHILSHDPSACVWGRSLDRTGAICRSDQSTESGWMGGERASRGYRCINPASPGSPVRGRLALLPPDIWDTPTFSSPQEGFVGTGARNSPALLAKQEERRQLLCSHPNSLEF